MTYVPPDIGVVRARGEKIIIVIDSLKCIECLFFVVKVNY